MKTLTSALAAILVIGSASVALADDLSIDQAADAMRHYGPVVNQPLTTKNVALAKNAQTSAQTNAQTGSSWMDRASQSFDGGF